MTPRTDPEDYYDRDLHELHRWEQAMSSTSAASASDPFASIPNADDSLNGEFSPARPRQYEITGRTEAAAGILRDAARADLPLPGYVTISSHDHGTWQSSQISIQLADQAKVHQWALYFGAEVTTDDDGAARAEVDFAPHHDLMIYCGAPEVPGLAEQKTVLVGDTYETPEDAAEYAAAERDALAALGDPSAMAEVAGLAEHTAAAPVVGCTCEYQSHFNGFGHSYAGVPAGDRRSESTGPICDDCADTHYAEFVTALAESTAAACDTIKAASE